MDVFRGLSAGIITRKITRSPGYAFQTGVDGSPCTLLLKTFHVLGSLASRLANRSEP